jgi:hypothetical protein
MKTSKFNQPAFLIGICGIAISLTGCTSSTSSPETTTMVETTTAVINSKLEIASEEYADLAEKCLDIFTQFDFDAWATMLSDDVEYHFPDGDKGTRTTLVGKEAVVKWWKNWKETSGIESMTYKDHSEIPINSKTVSSYTGLSGVTVLSYFSNELVFNGNPVNIRMNMAIHFNSDKKIDRFYAYYDRTKIIEAMKKNILAAGN